MSVVFHCSGCGSRFEVSADLAGRPARCKRCGRATRIPGSGTILPPRSDPPGAAVVARSATASVTPPIDWLRAVVASQVGLKPLTEAALPAIRRTAVPSPLDDASFSGLYQVRSMPSLPAARASGGRPAGIVTRAWRGQIGGIQGLARWINDSAYLLSVPFLVLLIFGAIVKNGPLATLSATVVVLLNLGRLVTGFLNLVLIPMKESPLKGLLFLIPPIGLGMIASEWKRYRKPAKRIIEPALTLGAVALAFALVPWLRGADGQARGMTDPLRESVRAIESGVREQMEAVPGQLEGLSSRARDLLDSGGTQDRSQSQKGEPGP